MTKFFQSACFGVILATSVAGFVGASPTLAQDLRRIEEFTAPGHSPSFDTPSDAVDKFKVALSSDDPDALAALLGLNADKLKASEDAMNAYRQIREGTQRQVILEDHGEEKVVEIGDKLWPFPFPLVKGADGKWWFDTQAGFQEIVDRRVGENELEAIATMRDYLDAQHEYASADRDGDGVLEYAQKLVSSPGKTDGLYWPPHQGSGSSPAGDLVQQAALQHAKQGDGYFGYGFRILTGQGPNVVGGEYSYVINGNMIAGFALIGWPVRYGETGVMTFMVNNQGVVYERDLGKDTEEIVSKIKRFNPDDKWDIVKD
jgi:hypothetical protein